METSNSTTCYYHLTPPPLVTTDSTGHIKGSDLRGSRGYERLVDMLSRFQAGTTPGTDDSQQIYNAVDEMKFKPDAILVARCHPGHSAADRAVRSRIDQPERAGSAGTAREDRMDSTDTARDRARARRSLEPAYRPAGFWQRAFNFATRFLGGAVPQAATMTEHYMAPTARDIDCPKIPIQDKADAEFSTREYERDLMALAFSATK